MNRTITRPVLGPILAIMESATTPASSIANVKIGDWVPDDDAADPLLV